VSEEQAVPVITFLSDYGLSDEFVGVCHGVIATRAPRARIIDLSHGIARHDVRAGAPTRSATACRARRWSDRTTAC
jgi:S-adenosylmethionine hydrolase